MLSGACAEIDISTGDLDTIRTRGVLRVILRPGFSSSPAFAEGSFDEVSLLRGLAARIGVRLEMIEAPRHDVVLPWLREGRGDLAVERFSPRELRRLGFAASAAVDWVEDVVVTRADSVWTDLDQISSRSIHLHGSRSAAIASELGAAVGGRIVDVVPIPEEIPLESVALRVRSGRYNSTVLDSGMVDTLSFRGGFKTLGPLAEPRPLAWAMRRENTALNGAVNDFLFAERVLARGRRTVACRDLDRIRQVGVLRLVTRNSPTTCVIERGGLEGFEYDLAHAFAASLGVRLELALPPPGVDPASWLMSGHGDLAALHEPDELVPSRGLSASRPYRKVDLVAISRQRQGPIEDMFMLEGMSVACSVPIQTYVREFPLEQAPDFAVLSPGEDSLSAIRTVALGEADVAIVDRDSARLALEDRPSLILGGAVLKDVGLVWLFAPHSGELKKSADRFLGASRRSGFVRLLARSELGTGGRWYTSSTPEVPDGRLTPYDDLLKREARIQAMDWRLMASLMYEESRFDPDAVGPGGSAGLFQFMPFTWRERGVTNPHDPDQATHAAAEYLKDLMAVFEGVELDAQMAMAIASYNVGPRHVVDARKLARDMELDDTLWAGNVETAMLILDEADVARNYPAGVCRCRRAVGYTRRILRRYYAYTEQFPPA
ncbi:MAG: transglycosylase SLT domain-containing protein [bacterium]|nr:transglycosylase SLT domain-containing protein [bacterium]